MTGNTSIDAVLETADRLLPPRAAASAMPRLLVTCHRRESWRDGLSSIAAAVAELGSEGIAEIALVLPPNAFVAETMRRLLADAPGVELLEPCGHDDMVRRMRDADLMLSDSGGVQEEAPALGVPLLVLRSKTERPEAIAAGSALLVGTNKERIIAEVRRLLGDPAARASMSRRVFPFGDGHAAERIAAITARWLDQLSSTHRFG